MRDNQHKFAEVLFLLHTDNHTPLTLVAMKCQLNYVSSIIQMGNFDAHLSEVLYDVMYTEAISHRALLWCS